MLVGEAGGDAATRGALQKADLHQVRLVHVLDGVPLLGDGGGQGLHADRAAAELLDQDAQQAAVELVQAQRVHFQHGEGGAGDLAGDVAVGPHLGEVADALEQPVGDARRPARAPGQFLRPVQFDGNIQDDGGAGDDLHQVFGRVELKVVLDAEAVSERRREQAGAGGRPDQGERVHVQLDGPRRRPLPDDDVHLVVFHRRVQNLLDGPGQPMDLVNEQDAAVFQVGQDGDQVAGPLDGRAGRGAQGRAHLVGDDERQARLAQPRRAVQQDVVQRLPPPLGGLQEDAQVLLDLGLPDELAQPPGPQ